MMRAAMTIILTIARTVTVESAESVMDCPICGVVEHSHDQYTARLVDTPCFGLPTQSR